MDQNQDKLETTLIGRNNKDIEHTGLPFELKPFGAVVPPKKGRREKLVIKGLQQFEVSHKHGAILCVNENVLKVFYGKNLSQQAEIQFDNQITCIKISKLDESLIAIGFKEINELHIFELFPFLSTKFLNQESLISIKIKEEFNQIQWNYKNNNLIVRNSESKSTYHIQIENRKIRNLNETDAVCFTLNGGIIATFYEENLYFEDESDLQNTINIEIETPKKLSRIFYIQEYQEDKWFVIGFNRQEVEDKANEDECDGMLVELVVLTGPVDRMVSKGKESILEISSNVEEINPNRNYLEFKIVKINNELFSVFQSITANSQTFQVIENGQKVNDIVEIKIKGLKGQVRGADYVSFKIDDDQSYLKYEPKGQSKSYSFIPPCVMTFDSELIISKYYFCFDLIKSEEKPNLQIKGIVNIEEQFQIKEIEYKPKEKVIQQQEPNNQNIQQNQKKEKQQAQQESEQKKPEENDIKQVQIEEQIQQQQDRKGDVKKQEAVIVNNQNAQLRDKQEEQENMIKPHQGEAIANVQNRQLNNEEEYLIKPDQIKYTKNSIKQLINSFKEYQSRAKKVIYSSKRSAYNHYGDLDTHSLQSYTNLQANYLKEGLDNLFKQPSIHSIDYIFEKDKLLICTYETDGFSYIYAFSFEEYVQIHQIIQKLESEFVKISRDTTINAKQKAQKKKVFIEEANKQIKDQMTKYKIFCSKTQILQIHIVYQYFLAIVFVNGVVLKSIDSILAQNPQNQVPFIAREQSSLKVKQVIFSQSKKYFLILSTDNQAIVMNTLTQELKLQKSDVQFANFSHDQENLVYILDSQSIQEYDFIKNQEKGRYNKISPQNNLNILHFEEYKPGSFFSVLYEQKILKSDCEKCENTACKECQESRMFVFWSNNISKFQQINPSEEHSWNNIEPIKENMFIKCHYNPQIKQLVSIFNQKGSIFILNIQDNDQIEIQSTVPQWSLFGKQISGFIYFPYREKNSRDFFYFKPKDENQKITYLLPSIMVFSGAFHLTRISLYDVDKAILTDSEDQKALQVLQQNNTLISIEEYTKLINNNIDSFTQYHDYYLLYEKMEQLKHILNFLEDNNIEDIIQAQLHENINKMEQPKQQPNKQQNQPRKEEQKENDVVNQESKLKKDDEDKIQFMNLIKQLQSQKPIEFTSIQKRAQKMLDIFLSTAYNLIESNIRFKSEIEDIPIKFNQNENSKIAQNTNNMNFIGINQIVHFPQKNITVFAHKNQLYLYEKNKSALIQMSESNRNSSFQGFTDIQFIQKFQQNDNKMHLLVALKSEQSMFGSNNKQNNLFHLVLDENPSRFKVLKLVHQYQTNQISYISTCNGEDKLLITYSNKSIEFLVRQNDNEEYKVIHKWSADFAIFSMLGTIYLGQMNNLKEYAHILHESGKNQLILLKETNVQQLAGVNFTQVVYMHQNNSECFLVVGISHTSFTPIPILSGSFTPITNQSQLNYSIDFNTSNVKLDSLQFKVNYSEKMKQLYLSNNVSNKIYVLPISLNQIIHKPVVSIIQLSSLKSINGFFQSHQDEESVTYEYFDFSEMKGSKIKFTKNKQSIFYSLDF